MGQVSWICKTHAHQRGDLRVTSGAMSFPEPHRRNEEQTNANCERLSSRKLVCLTKTETNSVRRWGNAREPRSTIYRADKSSHGHQSRSCGVNIRPQWGKLSESVRPRGSIMPRHPSKNTVNPTRNPKGAQILSFPIRPSTLWGPGHSELPWGFDPGHVALQDTKVSAEHSHYNSRGQPKHTQVALPRRLLSKNYCCVARRTLILQFHVVNSASVRVVQLLLRHVAAAVFS